MTGCTFPTLVVQRSMLFQLVPAGNVDCKLFPKVDSKNVVIMTVIVISRNFETKEEGMQ